MKYPLRTDYETVVKYPDRFIYDGILQQGKPVKQKQNQNFLLSHNGGKAVVYEIQTNPKKYALKCWIEDLGDLKIRYKAIDAYLKTVQLPYFVDFAYQEQGILVNGQRFPIIRMEWVDGISFKDFISNNINNPTSIRNFAEKFLEMVKILHQNNISHGDLQHGNIIVRKNGDLCLIDYDSLYVPQLSNETDNINGLPGYQHPNRNKLSKLSPKADYFSEMVIYLSLLVLSENPNYWQQIQQEERLLFSEKDLIKPNSSKIFKELKNLSPEIVYFTQELEKFCQQSNIENLQPLENLVNNYTGILLIGVLHLIILLHPHTLLPQVKDGLSPLTEFKLKPVQKIQNLQIPGQNLKPIHQVLGINLTRVKHHLQQIGINSINNLEKKHQYLFQMKTFGINLIIFGRNLQHLYHLFGTKF